MIKKLVSEKELTIEELVESIEMEPHINGTNLLKITERFPLNGERTSIVRTIEIEEEEGVLYFVDSDNVILSNTLVIGSLIKSNINKISKISPDNGNNDEDIDCYRLALNDGEIIIQPLVW